MRRLFALGIFLMVCAVGLAQFDMGKIATLQYGPAMAIQRSDVKKELKLSKDQDSQISKMVKELQQQMGGARNADPSMAFAFMDKIEKANDQILAILDDGQKKRFREIRTQMKGSPALLEDEYAKELELSDYQKSKLKELRQTYMKDAIGAGGNYKALMKKAEAQETDLLNVLTDSQRAKFKEIQGAPFKNARPKGTVF